MRREPQHEAKTETRVLGALAVVCYSATFTAMLAFGYSLLMLALEAAGRDLAALFSSSGI